MNHPAHRPLDESSPAIEISPPATLPVTEQPGGKSMTTDRGLSQGLSARKLKRLAKKYPAMRTQDAIVCSKFRKNAEWLDGKHRCCGCFRIGVDPIVGLLPVVGDFAGAILSVYSLRQLDGHDIPAWLISKMMVNIAIDTAIGLVPLIGDFADSMFAANIRNADLLEAYLNKRGSSTSDAAIRRSM